MSHDGDDMFGLMPDAESEVVSLAMGFSSDSPISSSSDATALNANTWSSSYNLTAVNESLFLEDLRDAGGGYFRRRKFNLSLIDLERLFPSMEAVSADVQVFLVAVYSLAAALSLLGNVTVILVLAFGKRSSVRCYLINLAVSDITMAAFCIPFSYTSFMFHRWIFAPEFCRVVAFMQHVSVTCSVYTLVAIGVDRHKALIHPLNTRWTKSRSRLVIGGIWVFSVLISLVPLVVSDTERFDWGGEWYYECKEQWPRTENEVYEKTYTVLLFVLTFALPVSGLGYTYLSIVAMMCTYRMPGNAEPSRDQHHLHAKIKMINMMIAVMVCFVLSWLPLQVLQFLIYFEPDITRCRGRQCYPYYMSFFACHWIAMANSFMNPFIYCFMSKNFREDFLQFLRKCGCRREPRRRSPPWSHSDLGSSFRSILNITHKTSVQSPSRAAAVGMRARQDGQRVEVEDTELKLLQPPYGSLRDTRGSAKWRVVRRSNSSSGGGGGGGGRGGSGKAVLALQAPASAAFTSTNMQDSYRKRSQEHHHHHHHRDQLSQQNNHHNHHHHHHHHHHHQQHRLAHSPQQHHNYHHHHQASLPHNSSPFLNASPPIGLPRSPVNSCFTEVNLMKET